MSHLFSSSDSLEAALQEPLGRRLVGDLFISIALVAVLVLAVNMLFLSKAPAGTGGKASWRHAGGQVQGAASRYNDYSADSAYRTSSAHGAVRSQRDAQP